MKLWSCPLLAALSAVPALTVQARAAQPPVPVDYLREAESQLAAGNVDRAIYLLEKGARTDGKVALRLGKLRESRGELLFAEDAYKAAAGLLSGAGKGEALGRKAVVEDSRGATAAAATSTEAAVAADSEGLWPTIALSYLRAHEGKVDEAVALAQKALAAGGGAAAKAALGRALQIKGDVAGAEAAYREAMAAEPTALAPVVGLATVLRKTDRAAEAEPLLQKAIEAAPGAAEAYKEMARVQIALGRPQEALTNANLAAALAEGDPEVQAMVIELKLARALQEVGGERNDLAVFELTRLRDQYPDSAAIRVGLGRAQIARRDGDAAVAELQKAVELDPKNAEAQYQLGYALQTLKRNPAAAVGPLEKAAAAEPGNDTYATALGVALTGAQRYDRAIDVLTKATAMRGYRNADGYVALGQAYVNLRLYQDAVPVLEKATSLAPQNSEGWAALGWAYFGLKDAAKFKEAAGKARSLGYKEATLLSYLQRVEAGEPIK
jgi:tetratricopeptide (TPR) repeat protein